MDKKVNISKELFEQIERYLLDKMLATERDAFEKEMDDDLQLRKEVVVQGEMMLAVEAGEMKTRLESIHQKITQKKSFNRWYLVAASITILVAIGIFMINRPTQTERLFAANMIIEPGLPVPMSATNNYNFYDAMVDYKSGKYELALSKWEPMLSNHPDNDTLNYFVGVAYFNNEDYENSIPYFERVISLDSPSFSEKAEWYMALGFLKTNDIDRLEKLGKESQSPQSAQIRQLYQAVE